MHSWKVSCARLASASAPASHTRKKVALQTGWYVSKLPSESSIRSALQGLTSWPQYASSESLQRLAFPCSLPSRCPPRRAGVEAARPQVHVALFPLVQIQRVSPNLKVLLHLQVFSRRQPWRHAVLPNVHWSTRTLVSWLCTPSYDGTLDEPRCTPCSLASQSTSHHELFALAKMVLNLKDFAANQ